MMNPYFQNPYSMLTGRVGRVGAVGPAPGLTPPQMQQLSYMPGFGPGGGLMVPGAEAAVPVPVPGLPGAPWGACPPSPAACGPCFPINYAQNQPPAFYAQQARRAVAAQAPQSQLGCNSREAPTGPAPILAGNSRVISTTPVVPMCITNYRVSRVSSGFFQIQSIKCQKIEYLDDNHSISADCFASDATLPPITMPCVYPGTAVTVTVLNIGAEEHEFWSQFIGFDGPGGYPCL